MTSPDITPHALSHTTHYTTAQTRHFVVSLGLRVWCWCMGGVCCVFRFVVCIVRVLGSVVCVFRVVSVVCGLVSRRHQSRRPSSRLCRLVAVALCLCVLCVIRFLVHTPAWNNKRGLVAYFVVWGVFRFFGVVIVCSVRVCCVHW